MKSPWLTQLTLHFLCLNPDSNPWNAMKPCFLHLAWGDYLVLCHGYVPATRCQVNARRVQIRRVVFFVEMSPQWWIYPEKKRDFSNKNGGIGWIIGNIWVINGYFFWIWMILMNVTVKHRDLRNKSWCWVCLNRGYTLYSPNGYSNFPGEKWWLNIGRNGVP